MDPVELRRLNFITRVPGDDRVWAHDRLRRLQRLARPRARASRPRCGARRAGRAARARRHEGARASASRPTSRCAGSRRPRILGAIRYVAGGWDAATIRCLPSGTVQVLTGTSPHGQGHETAWSQIAADELGYGVDEIEVLHGDTTVSPLGMDTYGSRSLTVGGIALHQAAREDRRQGARARCAPAAGARGRARLRGRDVHGRRQVGDDRRSSRSRPGTRTTSRRASSRGSRRRPSTTRRTSAGRAARTRLWWRSTPRPARSNCIRYVAVDDVGKVINPMIVDGQIHGGITQGVAQALYEEAIYDEDGDPADVARSRTTSFPRPSSCRRSSSTAPRRRARRTRSGSREWARRGRSPRRRR